MPNASVRSDREVPSYPCRQNNSIARSNACSVSNSRGRPVAISGPLRFKTKRYIITLTIRLSTRNIYRTDWYRIRSCLGADIMWRVRQLEYRSVKARVFPRYFAEFFLGSALQTAVGSGAARAVSLTLTGYRIHYLAAGKGEPIILLHGYAQTSHMWRPLMAQLAKTNTVIAPDLRGPASLRNPRAATTRK